MKESGFHTDKLYERRASPHFSKWKREKKKWKKLFNFKFAEKRIRENVSIRESRNKSKRILKRKEKVEKKKMKS